MKEQSVVKRRRHRNSEQTKKLPILNRPIFKHVMFLQTHKGKQFFFVGTF